MNTSRRTAAAAATTTTDVLLYIPNLIGYARVILCSISFVLMLSYPSLWIIALGMYLTSFVGDLIDGWLARKFNQTSQFGGVLDMITDRCGTLGLLYVLGQEYHYLTLENKDSLSSTTSLVSTSSVYLMLRIAFVFLQILDISSHWCQMHAALSLGVHHKSDQGNQQNHFLVQWFYKYYYFFGYLCVGAEFTYLLLYARQRIVVAALAAAAAGRNDSMAFWQQTIDSALVVTVPGCLAKQAVNVMQLISACRQIARKDAEQANYDKIK